MEIRIPSQYSTTKYILPLSPLYEPLELLEEGDKTSLTLKVGAKKGDIVSFVWPDSPTTGIPFKDESDIKPNNRMGKLFQNSTKLLADDPFTSSGGLTSGRPRALTLPQPDKVGFNKSTIMEGSEDPSIQLYVSRQRSSSIPVNTSSHSLSTCTNTNGGEVLRGLAAARERAKRAKLSETNSTESSKPHECFAGRRKRLHTRNLGVSHRQATLATCHNSMKLPSATENKVSFSSQNTQMQPRECSDSHNVADPTVQNRKNWSPVQFSLQNQPEASFIPDQLPACPQACRVQVKNTTESPLVSPSNRRYKDRRTSRLIQQGFQINVTVPIKRKETKLDRIIDKSASILSKRSREKLQRSERVDNSKSSSHPSIEESRSPSKMSNYSQSETASSQTSPTTLATLDDHVKSFVPEIMVDIEDSTAVLDRLLCEQKSNLFPQIPLGVLATSALHHYSTDVISNLVNHAREEAKDFAVLTPGEVDKLCEALANVEKKEETLRQAYASFRQSRSALLQFHLLRHLRNPSHSPFGGDSVLQQEIGLAALDSRADEWERIIGKMARLRSEIREKLLGHLIGSLALEYYQKPKSQQISTPPSSPKTL